MSPHGDAVFQPAGRGLAALRKAASACRGCDLYAHATQTVFGEGARRARVVLVGEQPGNDEDLAGTPFVGPAGRVLDEALQAAGLDRPWRSEEHTSELQSLMRNSYAVVCLKKKTTNTHKN